MNGPRKAEHLLWRRRRVRHLRGLKGLRGLRCQSEEGYREHEEGKHDYYVADEQYRQERSDQQHKARRAE